MKTIFVNKIEDGGLPGKENGVAVKDYRERDYSESDYGGEWRFQFSDFDFSFSLVRSRSKNEISEPNRFHKKSLVLFFINRFGLKWIGSVRFALVWFFFHSHKASLSEFRTPMAAAPLRTAKTLEQPLGHKTLL
jgi:hypothetical protein